MYIDIIIAFIASILLAVICVFIDSDKRLNLVFRVFLGMFLIATSFVTSSYQAMVSGIMNEWHSFAVYALLIVPPAIGFFIGLKIRSRFPHED